MPHYGYGDAWSVWMIVHGAFWLLLLALLVLGAIAVVRFINSDGAKDGSLRALDVLAERYARGEIPREEYLQLKKDILER